MNQEGKQLAFCANIRYLRKTHGLSKRKMARILGVGIKTLDSLENGILSRRLGSSVLIRTSDYFGVSTDDLWGCCFDTETME